MKQLFALLALTIFLTINGFAAEEKKVCVDKVTKDGKPLVGKDGKPEQDCKVIKIHKKLEAPENK
jgi:hypothetical protein